MIHNFGTYVDLPKAKGIQCFLIRCAVIQCASFFSQSAPGHYFVPKADPTNASQNNIPKPTPGQKT